MVWWAKPSNWVPTWPISLRSISSLLPRRFDCGFMNVRLVWMSKRRVGDMGIVGERTWLSSTTSPVRTSLTALSTESGLMWLLDPRSSPAPHCEGQRWLSEGGRQDGPWAAAVDRPSAAITARPMTMRRIESPLGWTLGDLDDAGLELREPVGNLWIVTRDHELGRAGERVDRVEGRQHLRQVRDDLHGLARLHVVIEVRGVGSEDDRPAPRLDGDDLESGGVSADPVHADARPHLLVALDDPNLVRVVQGHQMRERVDVGRAAKGLHPPERSRPERDLLALDPELRVREQAVAGPVVVVQMRDERDRHVGGLDAGALDHRRRAHVVADPARASVVVEESGVDQERVRSTENQPHEVVERELLVRRLAIEELAFRRIPLRVLERQDLVHEVTSRPGTVL